MSSGLGGPDIVCSVRLVRTGPQSELKKKAIKALEEAVVDVQAAAGEKTRAEALALELKDILVRARVVIDD